MVTAKTLLDQIKHEPPLRVPGSSVYLSGHLEGMPIALLLNLKHNRVLHETVGLLTIVIESAPRVRSEKRLDITPLGEGVYRIVAYYGYMQRADVRRLLSMCSARDLSFSGEETVFFLGRETLQIGSQPTMARWRKMLFVWMSRNAHDASVHFNLPPDGVVELGVRWEL